MQTKSRLLIQNVSCYSSVVEFEPTCSKFANIYSSRFLMNQKNFWLKLIRVIHPMKSNGGNTKKYLNRFYV
jgi:putative component of membrane protein insertase Oxa1/YidC/SpoIIIJ protein YidD